MMALRAPRVARAHCVQSPRMFANLVFVAIGAIAATTLAQPAPSATRGELLYNTHCIACHTTQVHWREQKLASDWPSLERQVRRWSGNSGLAWSNEEVADVVRYLNVTYYRFPAPTVTGAAGAHSTTPASTYAAIFAPP